MKRLGTSAPTTVALMATIERGPRSRIIVALDERDGSRFVSIKRLFFGKQGQWVTVRGVSLQLGELDTVATALRSASR